jgi:hypothetical protein
MAYLCLHFIIAVAMSTHYLFIFFYFFAPGLTRKAIISSSYHHALACTKVQNHAIEVARSVYCCAAKVAG